MFPEKNKSFTDRYHDLSLTIFNCYKKQTDQTSHEEVDINTTNNPSDDKHNGGEVKIPSVLFDLACEELKPIREALCSFLFNLFLILSFLLLAFYYITELDFGVKPVKKTLVGSSFDRFVSQRRFQVPRRRKTKTNGGLDHRRKSSSNCLSVLEQCFTS